MKAVTLLIMLATVFYSDSALIPKLVEIILQDSLISLGKTTDLECTRNVPATTDSSSLCAIAQACKYMIDLYNNGQITPKDKDQTNIVIFVLALIISFALPVPLNLDLLGTLCAQDNQLTAVWAINNFISTSYICPASILAANPPINIPLI